MRRIEGICVSVTSGLQGRQEQELELRLGYSSGGTNLGVTDRWLPACGESKPVVFRLALETDELMRPVNHDHRPDYLGCRPEHRWLRVPQRIIAVANFNR